MELVIGLCEFSAAMPTAQVWARQSQTLGFNSRTGFCQTRNVKGQGKKVVEFILGGMIILMDHDI